MSFGRHPPLQGENWGAIQQQSIWKGLTGFFPWSIQTWLSSVQVRTNATTIFVSDGNASAGFNVYRPGQSLPSTMYFDVPDLKTPVLTLARYPQGDVTVNFAGILVGYRAFRYTGSRAGAIHSYISGGVSSKQIVPLNIRSSNYTRSDDRRWIESEVWNSNEEWEDE